MQVNIAVRKRKLPKWPFNIDGGTYSIYVENEYGCTDTQTITLNEPEQIEDNFTTLNSACFGENSGSIDISLTGGTNPFTIIIGDVNTGITIEEEIKIALTYQSSKYISFNNHSHPASNDHIKERHRRQP